MQRLILKKSQIPFDIDLTLSCGQVFRWEKTPDYWIGVVHGHVCTIKQEKNTLIYSGFSEDDLIGYFNLNLDLKGVINNIRTSILKKTDGSVDFLFEEALSAGLGLRIIRQEPWECLMSFICSQNSNIPVIKKRIMLLSERYGTPLTGGWFSFPEPLNLSCLSPHEIRECSTGYRAPYLSETAAFICENPEFLIAIKNLPLQEARIRLMNLPGVGPKVADCVLLFAYNFYEVVPVDVWIRTIITNAYSALIDKEQSRKEFSYNQIADFCRVYFGQYAGYAQQYFFAGRHKISDLIKI